MKKILIMFVVCSSGLIGQTVDNGSGPIPATGRICFEEIATGRTCWTFTAGASNSLDSYVKIGDVNSSARNPIIGKLTVGANVAFTSRSNAFFWQVVNKLVPAWLQAQAKVIAQELQAQ